jgi:peptidyl-prolyl cis-trans isomerase A (cyclophilin A)
VNAAPTLLRAPLHRLGLGLSLVALGACPSSPADTAPKSGDAATKADAAKAAPGKAEAETKTAPTKAETTKAKVTTPAATGDAAAGTPAGQGAAVQKYRRGMTPPEGMTPEQVKEFAVAVGDPTGGEFTLAQAFEGDPALADASNGTLVATFDTSMGSFECELFEKEVPLTVANFVGLARGTRPTYDKKADAWVTKRYYDGNIFHRVIKGFMIQTGDATNTGRGNPGYVIVDELPKGLRHDSAGVLSMANREHPNTGSTQFFVTVRDTKHLDGKHAVFGKCADAKVPIEISKVSVDHRAGDRPYEQVKINAVTIARKPKGKGKGK